MLFIIEYDLVICMSKRMNMSSSNNNIFIETYLIGQEWI